MAYADDLALIGLAQHYDKNGLHLQGLLDTCDAFAKEHMFHFGFKKTKIIMFSPDNPVEVAWTLASMVDPPQNTADPYTLEQVSEYTYLGLRFSADLKWNVHFNSIVLPGCEAVLGRLKGHLTSHDMLSPKTAMMIIRALAVSKFKYGSAIWATDLVGSRSTPHTRLTKSNWDSIEDTFNHALYKILDLPPHANHLAVYRELGWEGLDFEVAKSKLGLFQKIASLSVNRLPKRILSGRISSMVFDESNGKYMHLHASMRTSSKCSYFLADSLNVLLSCPQVAHFPQMLVSNFTKLPTGVFDKLLRRRQLPGANGAPSIHSYLRNIFTNRLSAGLLATGAGSCYMKHSEWVMMADLAAIANGSQSLSYLAIPAFRTHGGGLGDPVTKFSALAKQSQSQSAVLSSCPWCRSPTNDDACHAIGCCLHPTSIAIRTEHTSAILSTIKHYRSTMAWRLEFDTTQGGREKARLILNIACQPHLTPKQRSTVTAKLVDLLCAIRKKHPTFARYFKGASLQDLCYY